MALDDITFRQLLDSVERFVRERLIPIEAEVDATDEVPEKVLDEMRALGLFGLTIPPEYGGLGLNSEEEVQIWFALTYAAPAFRSIVSSNNGIGSQGIVIDGTPAQKECYLARMARGELIGSFCLTEPEAGSDAASLRTTAIRDGDSYVINGSKRFISNAPRAGVLTVMARTDPGNKGAGGVSAFIVDAKTPGIRLGPSYKKMGQRGAKACDVFFEDCRVPAETLIGGVEGQGFKTAMKVLDRGRLGMASGCIGVARRLIREMVAYATARRQFGQPIADFQLIQAMIADSETEMHAARAMIMEAARLRDRGQRVTKLASMCKYFASEMVGRVADRAVQVHGGAGYIADQPVERLYRDARVFRLYEGTSQIQQLLIARETIRELMH
ncbi:MAG: acyl-CoA dehydrogenase family protein [Alphaproteobacteria bacterium]|nr:acyl-CoA dehydrogenase family protein [Alphaproteobacteria bacterium]